MLSVIKDVPFTIIQDKDGNTANLDDLSAYPSDRVFRDAWVLDGDVIEVDLDSAKDIWRENIRYERKPLLEALDAKFMKALETGDTATQTLVATQKQALRDATADSAIDAATTVEELKAARPSALDIEI